MSYLPIKVPVHKSQNDSTIVEWLPLWHFIANFQEAHNLGDLFYVYYDKDEVVALVLSNGTVLKDILFIK